MRFSSVTLALLALVTTVFSYAQASVTVQGTVTDAMCGADHMMKNASAAECTRACVKNGSDFALVSDGKLYTLKGDKSLFDKWAGQKGKVSGTTITVDTMTEK